MEEYKNNKEYEINYSNDNEDIKSISSGSSFPSQLTFSSPGIRSPSDLEITVNLRDLIKQFESSNLLTKENSDNSKIIEIPLKYCEVSQYFMEDDLEVSKWLLQDIRNIDSEYKKDISDQPFSFLIEINGSKKYICTSLGLIKKEFSLFKSNNYESNPYTNLYDNNRQRYLYLIYEDNGLLKNFYYSRSELLKTLNNDTGLILKLENPEPKILYENTELEVPINNGNPVDCYKLVKSTLI